MIYLNPNRYENACDNHYQKIHKIILNEIESHKKTRLQYCLKNYIKENLKDIITGFPNVLLEKNNEFLELIQKRKNRKIAEQEAEVRKIISYKNFQHKNKTKYDAFDLAENLNANTCSYCNRQYTVTVLDKKSEEGHIARPQFDHFFPQSKYPLLALSFYNLIPSCSICNGTLKRDQEFNLDDYIHPYLHDCNQHFRFSFSPLNIQSLKGAWNHHQILVKTDVSNDQKMVERIQNSFNVFKIAEIYNAHVSEVSELVRIREVMSDRYLEILKRTYNFTISDDELYRLAFGTFRNEDQFQKRPLSKLKKDILSELGII